VTVQAGYMPRLPTTSHVFGRDTHPDGSTKGRGLPIRHGELCLMINREVMVSEEDDDGGLS
jgi:hypothetical protein